MKLNWGMIGGGEGSQIGPAHRIGAQADGLFTRTLRRGESLRSAWAWRRIVPMATGTRCWRVSAGAMTGWNW